MKTSPPRYQVRNLTIACTAVLFLFASVIAHGQDDEISYSFDKPSGKLIHPRISKSNTKSKSDLAKALALHSPAKDQGGRGTCAIFVTAGILEFYLNKKKSSLYDLSEQYIEYKVKAIESGKPSGGSNVYNNIDVISQHGVVDESVLPYHDVDWTDPEIDSESAIQRDNVCGHYTADALNYMQLRCWLGQLDPLKDIYGSLAVAFRDQHNLNKLAVRALTTTSQIKDAINQLEPVNLSLEVFYGAFNHSYMRQIGLGAPDRTLVKKGVIKNPTEDDVRLSREHPGRHGLLIVGYDDIQEIYYVKNSWGTDTWGSEFAADEIGAMPGFGTIPYSYAHTYGQFSVTRERAN
jgi:hypothetical protein